ncbi:hypothetical protein [Cryptosporangium minutisporangium]|uniref:hypothetical protein n=1 Tax=Cryptosporangium minutisporangium TaxID=113569 RepID=UPI0031F16B18
MALLARASAYFYTTHICPQLFLEGEVRELAIDVAGADGQRLPALANLTLIRDESESPTRIQMVVFPVERRRRHERHLVAGRQALAQRLAERMPDGPQSNSAAGLLIPSAGSDTTAST